MHAISKVGRGLILTLAITCQPVLSDDTSSRDKYYESASTLYFQGDHPSALIELKNALQQDPEHVPSLLLMGQTQISMDMPLEAEESLIKARVLGADPRVVDLQLAKVYLRLAKYQDIIDNLPADSLPAREKVELLGYRTEAWLAMGNEPEAAATLAQAEALAPDDLRVLVARSRLHTQLGELARAQKTALKATEKYPQSGEAWNTLAAASHARGELNFALQSYQEALNLEPDLINTRLAKIGLLIEIGEYSATLEDLDFFNEKYPIEPRAAYFRGLVYGKLSDSNDSFLGQSEVEFRKSADIIAALPPVIIASDIQLSMIGALSFFSLGEFETSKKHLETVLQVLPYDLGANRLMGRILLKIGDPSTAVKQLRATYRMFPEDYQLLDLLASAYAKAGMPDKASELLTRIETKGFATQSTREKLAISQLQAGRISEGITSLESMFNVTRQFNPAAEALIVAQLKARDYARAIENTQSLLNAAPNNLPLLNMLGVAQRGAGQLEKARASFLKILELVPDHIPARINLAKIYESLNQPAESRGLLEGILQQAPEDANALLAMALFERRQGNLSAALKLAESAEKSNPGQLDTRQLLVELHLDQGDTESALNLAIDTVAKQGNNFDSRTLMAQTYLRSGSPDKAINLYKGMVKESGFNSESLHKLSRLLIEAGAFKDARHALYKSLEGDPGHLPSAIDYIRLQLTLGEFEDSLKRSLALSEKHPENLFVRGLLGDSYVGLKQFQKAEATFAEALKINATPPLILGHYRAQMAQDKVSEATRFLDSQWRSARPNNGFINALYLEHLVRFQQFERAMEISKRLPDDQLESPANLINLAITADRLGNTDALQLARRAQALSPQNPVANDVLGWRLVKEGSAAEGLGFLRQAVTIDSGNPSTRYHLARALFDLNRKDEARHELTNALSEPREFEGRAEAEELLKNMTPITN